MRRKIIYISILVFVTWALWFWLGAEQLSAQFGVSTYQIKDEQTSIDLRNNEQAKALSSQKDRIVLTSPTVDIQKQDPLQQDASKNCIPFEDIVSEIESMRDYQESYGQYDRTGVSQPPEYWQYSKEELRTMVKADIAQAKYMLGLKLIYDSLALDRANFHALPITNEINGQLRVGYSNDIFDESIENYMALAQFDQRKMEEGRQLLYDASVDGLIGSMYWIIVSYNLEQAYLQQQGDFLGKEKTFDKQRLIFYALWNELFISKFGALTLRPHHLENASESTKHEIAQKIEQFHRSRASKGLAPLKLIGFADLVDRDTICDVKHQS